MKIYVNHLKSWATEEELRQIIADLEENAQQWREKVARGEAGGNGVKFLETKEERIQQLRTKFTTGIWLVE